MSRLDGEHRFNSLCQLGLKKEEEEELNIYKMSLKLEMEKWTESNIKCADTISSLDLGPADESLAIPDINRCIRKKCNLSGRWKECFF